jgi:hypothetical protein
MYIKETGVQNVLELNFIYFCLQNNLTNSFFE